MEKAMVVKRVPGRAEFTLHEGTNETASLFFFAYRNGVSAAGAEVKNVGHTFTVKSLNGEKFDVTLREALA